MDDLITRIRENVISLTHRAINTQIILKELYLSASDKQTKNKITEALKLLDDLKEEHQKIINEIDEQKERA